VHTSARFGVHAGRDVPLPTGAAVWRAGTAPSLWGIQSPPQKNFPFLVSN